MVVHADCLLSYVRFKSSVCCTVCDEPYFDQTKRRLSRRKKMRLTIEAIEEACGRKPSGIVSPGCRITPTCSLFKHFFGGRH